MADGASLRKILEQAKPAEIYNLAAQSHVRVSFDQAEYTADVVGTGTLRLLEAVREYAESGIPSGFTRPDRLRCSARRRRRRTRKRRFIRAALMQWAKSRLTGSRKITGRRTAVYRQRDSVQPRIAAPRRDVRDPKNHARADPDQAGPAGETLSRQSRFTARLGLCRAISSRRCG